MRSLTRTAVLPAALFLAASPALAAGDVTAAVDGQGVLLVVGGAGSEYIEVSGTGEKRVFVVTGLAGTTVNGASSERFEEVRGLHFQMNDGDDEVEVREGKVRRHLVAELGNGDDILRLRDLRVRGRTIVRCGEGRDLVNADAGCRFRRTVRVFGGEAGDTVRFVRSKFRRRLRIVTRGGNDKVTIGRCTLRSGARAQIVTGRGRDDVSLNDSGFNAATRIVTGKQHDFVRIDHSYFGEDVGVQLGPSFDEMRVVSSRFKDDVEFDGGHGDDDYLDLDRNKFEDRKEKRIRFRHFEHFD